MTLTLPRVPSLPGWRTLTALLGEVSDRRTDRIIEGRERQAASARIGELRWRWQAACERGALGLAHLVSTPGGGTSLGRMPLVVDVDPGDADGPVRLMVELPPQPHLDGCEPEREGAAVVLDEDPHEPLE